MFTKPKLSHDDKWEKGPSVHWWLKPEDCSTSVTLTEALIVNFKMR